MAIVDDYAGIAAELHRIRAEKSREKERPEVALIAVTSSTGRRRLAHGCQREPLSLQRLHTPQRREQFHP
jgi:hypothetical protein